MATCHSKKGKIKFKFKFSYLFLCTVLISIVASFLNTLLYQKTNRMSLVAVSSQIILILPCLIYFIGNKINPLKQMRLNKLSISTIVLLILFTFLVTPVMTFINALSLVIFKNETVNSILQIVDESGLILSLVLVAVIPAIFEEIVYRGVFYNGYQNGSVLGEYNKGISKRKVRHSILLSGILFGVIHMNGNQFSYAFVMGIVFALVIEATNSLYSTMLIHFLINGTSILISYIAPKLLSMLQRLSSNEEVDMVQIQESLSTLPSEFGLSMVIANYGFTALISGVLAVIVFRTIAKNNNRWEYIVSIFKKGEQDQYNEMKTEEGYRKEKSIGENIPLLIGIGICIVIMIIQELR